MRYLSFILLSFLFITACTPKTAEKTVETKEEPVATTPIEEELSPCKNWERSPNQDELMSAHVLYKDGMREIRSLKQKDATGNAERIKQRYVEVLELWKTAYEGAPAADGKRPDHFDDGIRLYEHFYSVASDQAGKNEMIAKIMKLYEERGKCYGDEAYSYGAIAFDYYYKYPGLKTEMEIYNQFKKAMDIYKDSADYFILNPFTALLSNLVIEEKIPIPEAQKYARYIRNSIANGLATAKTPKAKEPWNIVNDYAPARLDQLEGVKGFYDCAYFKEKYLQEWKDNPNDCDAIIKALGRMKWGGCGDADQDQVAVSAAYESYCKVSPDPVATSCRSILKDGDYNGAVACYSEKGQSADDPEKRAQYNLITAKIYYGELKRFGDARKYARLALKDKPNWGDPYILIGKLYASSGPLCGPGRGWDSQIVTWPAIDKWQQAKRVDPSVATQANKLIRQYEQYMPDKGEIFLRSLKEGDSFRVPCWIQENTTIRAAK